MIELVAGFILGAAVAFHAGFYGRELLDSIRHLKPTEKAPTPLVTVGSATRGQNLEQNTAQIVRPLPPSVIKQREDEELRRMRYS